MDYKDMSVGTEVVVFQGRNGCKSYQDGVVVEASPERITVRVKSYRGPYTIEIDAEDYYNGTWACTMDGLYV